MLVRFSAVSFGLFRQIPGNMPTDLQYVPVVSVYDEMHALEVLRGQIQLMSEAIDSRDFLEFDAIQNKIMSIESKE